MLNSERNLTRIANSNSIPTPSLIYVEELLDESLDLVRQSMPRAKIFFALKSCYNESVLAHFSHNCGAEVMSELEYTLAERCGFKTSDIIVNGMGRSAEFLRKAISKNSIIIIDSESDLEKISEIRNDADEVRLGIRLKVDVSEFQSSPYKNKYNKLGVCPSSDLFKKFIKIVKYDNVSFSLLHCHFAINELDPAIYLEVLRQVKKILNELKIEHPSLKVEMIDIGGGFEVYDEKIVPRFKYLFSSISKYFESNFPGHSLAIEPGRYLVNHAGLVKTKVIDKKSIDNTSWCYVDAGGNMLIPNSHARYAIAYPLNNISMDKNYSISVGDCITSPAHVYVSDVGFSVVPGVGDILILSNCGAYTDVYSSFWVADIYQVYFLKNNGELICNRSSETILKIKKLFLNI